MSELKVSRTASSSKDIVKHSAPLSNIVNWYIRNIGERFLLYGDMILPNDGDVTRFVWIDGHEVISYDSKTRIAKTIKPSSRIWFLDPSHIDKHFLEPKNPHKHDTAFMSSLADKLSNKY